jgi:nitroreductase
MTLTKDVWQIREEGFPHGSPIERQLVFLLGYAILAPSNKNTQPWRFAVVGDTVEFYADLDRWQRVSDPDKRELHLSLGCALENFLVAAARFGFGCAVSYAPERGSLHVVARVRVTPRKVRASPRAESLFYAITARFSDTSAFVARTVPRSDIDLLKHCAAAEGVGIRLSSQELVKERIEELMIDADMMEYASPAYRDELGQLVRNGVFGESWLLAQLGQLALTHLNMGSRKARRHAELLWSAPLFGVMATKGNSRQLQIRCGQAFERLFLTATAVGLSVHPMSQALHFPELRQQIAAALELEHDDFPQQAFRIGFSEKAIDHTPRRPLGEVLVPGVAAG